MVHGARLQTDAVNSLQVGNGLENGITQGPLIDENAIVKVQEHIADSIEKGSRILTGGKPHKLAHTFFEPMVIADATPDMMVAKEEASGLLAPLFKFETEDEAPSDANDTDFGLAAYVFSSDLGRIWRVFEKIERGMVGINTGIMSTEIALFGSIKQSGIDREGSHYSIEDYLELKYLCIAI